jgi:16S rRNA (guanine966-N2)-methyltransferase
MNLRIVAGKYGGRTIKAPSGGLTHPMSERIRGSLFNILSEKVVGAIVLDAFAGTGSLGLEAMSRGAKCATFIERDKLANRILDENIKTLGLENNVMRGRMGLSTWIDDNLSDLYDIIFVDPPYNDMQFAVVSKLANILSDSGVLILSHSKRVIVPNFDGLKLVDHRNYGDAEISFYNKLQYDIL